MPPDQALLEATERVRVVGELSRQLADNASNYEAILQTLVRRAAELVGDGAILTTRSGDGKWLERVAHYHRDPRRRAAGRELLAGRYPADQGPAGQVVQTAMPVRTPAAGPLPPGLDSKYIDYANRFAIEAYLIVPLRVGHQVVGTLGVSRRGPGYSDRDEEFLQLLGDTAALTIATARLHAEASQRRNRLALIHQGEMASIASFDRRRPLDTLLDQVRSGLPVDLATIANGFDRRPVRRAVDERRTIFIPDLSATGDPTSSIGSSDRFVSYLAVPLMAKGEILAVLELFNRAPLDPDSEWWQFLETVTARASWAARNSRVEQPRPLQPDGRLSPHQQAIYRLLVQGKSNREIAKAMHVTEHTVKFHIRELFRKLGVRNRVEAATLALNELHP